MRLKLDIKQIQQWTLTETSEFINSKAWQEEQESEQKHQQFLADIAKSINETNANAARAIIKTLAA